MNNILIVEDDPTTAAILEEFLKSDRLNIGTVTIKETGYEALEHIQGESPDLILLDLGLPDINGMDLIPKIQKSSPSSEIIVVTGEKSAESALKAIQLGARDYLVKPIKYDRLHVSIQNALDRINLARQLDEIQNEDNKKSVSFYGFIGKSNVMRNLYKNIENVAQSNDTVLITGEDGTGKTLCAEHIHKLSKRSSEPFTTINCVSINDQNTKNNFQELTSKASKGTLYLKQITELPLEAQAELIKILESNPKMRIICSSTTPVIETVRNNNFREDLYYRLNILPIDIPPLRRRSDDIQLIASYFLSMFSDEQNKEFKEFDDLSIKLLSEHHWPGNVRELKNLIKSIVTMNAEEEETVRSNMLPRALQGIEHETTNENEVNNTTNLDNIFYGDEVIPICDLERMAIEHALKVCNGNVQKAALKLKISPATLYRKKPSIEDQ